MAQIIIKLTVFLKPNTSKYSTDMAKFKTSLKSSKMITFVTGAGISAESGIPTLRGEGGFWTKYHFPSLATPSAFQEDPSYVWEFYHFRREQAFNAKPSLAHIAVANFETKHKEKTITVITQNIDCLHTKAGTRNLLELHGSLFKTRCTKCNDVVLDLNRPLCKGLANKSIPENMVGTVPEKELPHCKKPNCGGLLRPHVVWFREGLDPGDFDKATAAMDKCEACLVIGTSSLVYPMAGLAPLAALRGAVVAEFNVSETKVTKDFQYHFKGPCGLTVPVALAE